MKPQYETGPQIDELSLKECCLCASHAGFTDDWVLLIVADHFHLWDRVYTLLGDLKLSLGHCALKGDDTQTLTQIFIMQLKTRYLKKELNLDCEF